MIIDLILEVKKSKFIPKEKGVYQILEINETLPVFAVNIN